MKEYIISEANLWYYKKTIIGHKFNGENILCTYHETKMWKK